MNDRYLYFPLTGLAGVTALLTDKAILQGRATAKRIVVALAVVLTVVLGGIACRQTGIWKNDVVLWSHLIEKSPPPPLYFWRLGEAYRFSGNPSAAVAAYYRSLELNPDYAKAHLGAAEALLQAGRPAEALNHALVIVRKFPARPLGFTLMGEAYLQLGERDKAESALSRAIQLSPRDSRTVAALKMLAR
jgi:tetratricopeptide (TPR) repeat protein